MSDDLGARWWAKICTTVTKWGQPRPTEAPIVGATLSDRTLDLHGMTIHVAFHRAKLWIADNPNTDVLIITGKSGQIAYEFPDWARQWGRVVSYQPQNGGGAYRVRLRPL